jgi:3-phenylpropionate/trans-cinnamate dioxygenase ferredoxin reductase subunit
VIVGIGIIPNTELASDAGIECENGILVDDHCCTSDEDIYAVGDCTNHPNALLGKRLRLESVPNAIEQGRVAAANIQGNEKVYCSMPWFWSDQYDLKLQMSGFSTGADQHITRGSIKEQQFLTFHLKEGVLVGVDSVNSPKEFLGCKKLVEQGARDGIKLDPSRIADISIPINEIQESTE